MRLLGFLPLLVPFVWYFVAAPMLCWRELLVAVRHARSDAPASAEAGVAHALEEAVGWWPDNSYVHLYRGYWSVTHRDAEGATASFQRAAELAQGEGGALLDVLLATGSTPGKPPGAGGTELMTHASSPADALRLAPVALFRRDAKLAAELLARAAGREEKSFAYRRAAGFVEILRGRPGEALAHLEVAWPLRSAAAAAPGFGIGFVPFRMRAAAGESSGSPALRLELGPWLGLVTSSARELREASVETLHAMVVLAHVRASYRKSLHWAQVLAGSFAAEVAALGLGGNLDRYLYPRGYGESIEQAAARHRVDPFLVHAIVREESHYDAGSKSKAGAVGLMQLMPQTAAWAAGRMKDPAVDGTRLDDPLRNIAIGCWYLAHLTQGLPKDARRLEWLLAAYNAGPGNANGWIARWKKSGGEPLAAVTFPETRDYVQKVSRSYANYRRVWNVDGAMR